MKVLVATELTQGARATDFCWVPTGRLLGYGFECDRDCEPDGPCGCRRSFVAIEGERTATTTALICDLPITTDQLADTIHESLVAGGWFKGDDPEGREFARADAQDIATLAAKFRIGDVVEKRGQLVQTRRKRVAEALRMRALRNPQEGRVN